MIFTQVIMNSYEIWSLILTLGCDPYDSCYWASCHDDIAFTKAIIEYVKKKYCLDEDSIHLTGISNGGMFSYFGGNNRC